MVGVWLVEVAEVVELVYELGGVGDRGDLGRWWWGGDGLSGCGVCWQGRLRAGINVKMVNGGVG